MNNQHILLSFSWILYCIIHSALAHPEVKNFIQRLMGKYAKYYRIIYSLFAAITLAGIIYFQIAINSTFIFQSKSVQLGAIIVLVLPGLIIMGLCIKKYFYELSGIQALNNEPLHITLQQEGMHKYVRHPLYSGTLLFVWGLFFVIPLLSNLLACIIMTVYVLIGIRFEEQKLRIEFGEEYRNYSRKVAMIIPGLL